MKTSANTSTVSNRQKLEFWLAKPVQPLLVLTASDSLLVDSIINKLRGKQPFQLLEFGSEETLGISEIRRIKSLNNERSGSRVIVIYGVDNLRHESQNALLKTLEEPTAGTSYVLTASRLDQIIDTLRSRTMVVGRETGGGGVETDPSHTKFAASFINAPPLKRAKVLLDIDYDRDKMLALIRAMGVSYSSALNKAAERNDQKQLTEILTRMESLVASQTALETMVNPKAVAGYLCTNG